MTIDTSESLTLDTAARARATHALQEAIQHGLDTHFCVEWDDGDGCEICWAIVGDVIRAAEGLGLCLRCNGGGMVAPGDCCPQCAGDGLWPLDLPGEKHETSASDEKGER